MLPCNSNSFNLWNKCSNYTWTAMLQCNTTVSFHSDENTRSDHFITNLFWDLRYPAEAPCACSSTACHLLFQYGIYDLWSCWLIYNFEDFAFRFHVILPPFTKVNAKEEIDSLHYFSGYQYVSRDFLNSHVVCSLRIRCDKIVWLAP